jgi:hypothetical protein
MTDCLDHDDGPSNYVDWFGWAERRSKTHRQKRCGQCQLWAIWERIRS